MASPCVLSYWRMLDARGQRLTFFTDHIHYYYHHCFSSNRAERHIPARPQPAKWENGTVISQQWRKGEKGEQEWRWEKKASVGQLCENKDKGARPIKWEQSYTSVCSSASFQMLNFAYLPINVLAVLIRRNNFIMLFFSIPSLQ